MRRDYRHDQADLDRYREIRSRKAPVAQALESRLWELEVALPYEAFQERMLVESLVLSLSHYVTFDLTPESAASITATVEKLESLARNAKDLAVLETYAATKETK